MRFQNKVALITGAGSGIARETALQLGAAGACVAVSDINADTAAGTADAIRANGGQATHYVLDVSDRTAVDDTVSSIEGDLGPIGYLVNLAGSFATAPLAEISDDLWTQTTKDIDLFL